MYCNLQGAAHGRIIFDHYPLGFEKLRCRTFLPGVVADGDSHDQAGIERDHGSIRKTHRRKSDIVIKL